MKLMFPTSFRAALPCAVLLLLVQLTLGAATSTITTSTFSNSDGIEASYKEISDVRSFGEESDGSLDLSFRPQIDFSPGYVQASVVQPDGKTIVGGYFRTLNGSRYDSLVRLNEDGSIDASFAARVTGGAVNAIALQPDGKILIVGAFTAVDGTRRTRLARLNSNGSVDQTFDAGSGADDSVYDVAIQPDGKILIGGFFSSVNSTTRNFIARLNADGSVDTGFTSPFPPQPPPEFPDGAPRLPAAVFSIALQADGKIVVGGFLVLNFSPQIIYNIVALNSNGTLNSSFDVRLNGTVYKIIVQPDGKLLICGFFTTVGTSTRRYIARLNPNGSLDTLFDAGSEASAPVQTLYVKPDGKIVFGSRFAGGSSGFAKQLNQNGSLDFAFVPTDPMTGSVYTISPAANGKLFIGGSFASLSDDDPNTALRFNADGSPDPSFSLNSTAIGGVRAIVTQADGKIIMGGNFNRVNGVKKHRLARLNPDGTLDATFNAPSGFQSSTAQVNALLAQTDGKVLVAGTGIIRLNPNGTTDTSFTPVNVSGVRAIALQADGKILYSPGVPAPTGSRPVARLNSDGTSDNTFVCDIGIYGVDVIVPLPDGKILAGGPFSFGYVSSGSGTEFHNGVLRLNTNGSHDRTFISGLASNPGDRFTSVYAVERLPDGRILVGGRLFTPAASTTPVGIIRMTENGAVDESFERGVISSPIETSRVEDLLLLPSGKILVGGNFTAYGSTQLNNIVRLGTNGSIDAEFGATTDNTIYELALHNNGDELLGGDFDSVNGVSQSSLARLSASIRTLFDYDGDGRADLSVRRPSNDIWYLQQSTAGYTGFTWGIAGDRMVPADYDGDGRTDIAVFRPSEGRWYIYMSQSQSFQTFNWGADGDLPVPTDRDADGKTDLVVYRESNNTWYSRSVTAGPLSTTVFGAAGDKPIRGDFDADGRGDNAIFRPSTSTWYIQKSATGFFVQTWGQTGDIPTPADFDGDGSTDLAIFRPGTGQWYLSRSTAGFSLVNWGQDLDLPIPADYDGDGKADPAVFRPGNGTWYMNQSAAGFLALQFGQSGDVPTPSAFIY